MKRSLPLLLLANLLLPIAASGAGAEGRPDNVGKLAIVTKSCSRNLDGQPPQGCARLMLDQIQSNLLAVRFIARGSTQMPATNSPLLAIARVPSIAISTAAVSTALWSWN